jgi:hypothetical protein
MTFLVYVLRPRQEGVSLLDSDPKKVHLIDSTDKALNNLRGCSI